MSFKHFKVKMTEQDDTFYPSYSESFEKTRTRDDKPNAEARQQPDRSRKRHRVSDPEADVATDESDRPTSSGIKGVYCSGKRWRVTIKRDGAQRYLGVYETKEAAVAAITAYDKGGIAAVQSSKATTSSSRVKGVNRSGKKWMAQAYRNGRTRYLGTYDSKEAAVAAIDQFDAGEEVVLHGRTYQSSSGIKGISKNGKKWSARSYRNGILRYLGAYDSKEDAAQAIIEFENMIAPLPIPQRGTKGSGYRETATLMPPMYPVPMPMSSGIPMGMPMQMPVSGGVPMSLSDACLSSEGSGGSGAPSGLAALSAVGSWAAGAANIGIGPGVPLHGEMSLQQYQNRPVLSGFMDWSGPMSVPPSAMGMPTGVGLHQGDMASSSSSSYLMPAASNAIQAPPARSGGLTRRPRPTAPKVLGGGVLETYHPNLLSSSVPHGMLPMTASHPQFMHTVPYPNTGFNPMAVGASYVDSGIKSEFPKHMK